MWLRLRQSVRDRWHLTMTVIDSVCVWSWEREHINRDILWRESESTIDSQREHNLTPSRWLKFITMRRDASRERECVGGLTLRDFCKRSHNHTSVNLSLCLFEKSSVYTVPSCMCMSGTTSQPRSRSTIHSLSVSQSSFIWKSPTCR